MIRLEFMGTINKTKMLQMPCFDYHWICLHLYALLFNILNFLSSWVSGVCFCASRHLKEIPFSLFQVFQLFIVFLMLTFQWFALEFIKTLVSLLQFSVCMLKNWERFSFFVSCVIQNLMHCAQCAFKPLSLGFYIDLSP